MPNIGLTRGQFVLVIYPVTMIRLPSGPHKLQKLNFGSAQNLDVSQMQFTPPRQRKARSASPLQKEKHGK
jgi:hypothetical protein